MLPPQPLDRLKAWARSIKIDVMALWLAARDPRVPMLAKVMAAVVAAYALSPIDLIPDFIPILGYLDDLVIVPLGILLAVRLVPAPIMHELRASAMEQARVTSKAGLAVIVILWCGGAALAAWVLWR
ncbi:MAG: hypothetical protein C0409_00615 [Novosphingobium sp.]|nr:hypothetical protein [Novosphingobium sp.]